MSDQILVAVSALMLPLAVWMRIWRHSWATFALVVFAFLVSPAAARGCDGGLWCDAVTLMAAFLPVAMVLRAIVSSRDDRFFRGGGAS